MNHKFKLKQRVAALCMAAMMCCSLFPVRAFAEAPRADADGTLIMEQDKEAVTDDSHQTEAGDPDPGEESTPKSSEVVATSQSADEDASVETSTDYTFDGAVLYTDLPDVPTGSYMGSQGLPVATGETKIGISAWPNDQLEESVDSYLSTDTLNSDDLTLTAPLLEGTDYAVAPILAQVEYPADGSSLDVVLPNEVTVLDFYGVPADEATRSSLVHSEYAETSAAVMGLYVQADADFSAQLVYTAPDGSTLTKALHVVIDCSRTMAAPFAETTDVAAYAERPTPAVTSGKITKVEKVNGTWLIWFNGEEAYCCTHGANGQPKGCPPYTYTNTSLVSADQCIPGDHYGNQYRIWGGLDQLSMELLPDTPVAFSAEDAERISLLDFCRTIYDDTQLWLIENYPESTAAKIYLESAQALLDGAVAYAKPRGYYTYIYTPARSGWQTVALIGPEISEEETEEPKPVVQEYYANWEAPAQSASGTVDLTYGITTDKIQLKTLEKVDGATIEIEPITKSGTIDGGSWSISPAGMQTVTTGGHTNDDNYQNMEAQLSIIKDPQQLGQLYPTYVQKKRTTSNRTEVRKKLNFCLERATNYAQFLQMAQELGISVCQRGKHMTYLLDGAGRAIRDTSLADTDKFTYTGLVERLEDNAAEQQFIRERIAKIFPSVSTFTDFIKQLQSEGVKARVKKQTGQLLYKAADLDGTWVPADALGDGFTLAGLENTIKNKSENLDTNHSTPIAELYQELTTNYPQSCDTSVRLTSRQICSAGKRGVLLQIHDSSGNPAKLMIDNSHIHTTPDGSVSADIGAAFSYDITYDDGTHGTIRGTDLIRQIDEENLTQPLIVSLTADQIMAMSLRGVTVHLPQYHIERLFIPERYVQRNVEQGSCAISLYPGWQYSYVPISSEKTRKSISGSELAQSLGGVVQVGTSESSLARRVANVERRAGIANAQELGKLLGSMADNGLHSAADFDKQISAYQREEMKLRNKIAELRSKSKTYAATAHNLQVCRTNKSVWLEYASKPLAQKDTFYKQNEAALQAYSRAASQLDKMGISLGTEPEKVRQLVTETESRIADLIAELEIVRTTNQAIQEDKEKVEQIQSG